MTTFNYTGGALSNLTGNTPGANVSNLVTVLNDLKTFLNGANLDATNIAAHAITAALIEAQQAWQTVALSSGSTVFTPANLSYMKDSLGFVHIRGEPFSLGTAAVLAGATICTLPAGYRPVVAQRGEAVAAGGASEYNRGIEISTAGVLKNVSGFTMPVVAGVSFAVCAYRAEN